MTLKPPFFVDSVLNEDWTCKELSGFQRGLSRLEQSFRWGRVGGETQTAVWSPDTAEIFMTWIFSGDAYTVPTSSMCLSSLICDYSLKRLESANRHFSPVMYFIAIDAVKCIFLVFYLNSAWRSVKLHLLFICFFRSWTPSIYSRCSASPCG